MPAPGAPRRAGSGRGSASRGGGPCQRASGSGGQAHHLELPSSGVNRTVILWWRTAVGHEGPQLRVGGRGVGVWIRTHDRRSSGFSMSVWELGPARQTRGKRGRRIRACPAPCRADPEGPVAAGEEEPSPSPAGSARSRCVSRYTSRGPASPRSCPIGAPARCAVRGPHAFPPVRSRTKRAATACSDRRAVVVGDGDARTAARPPKP
jgi:hypothetical protein